MLTLEQHMDILQLHRQGHNKSQIARLLGIDRKTVRTRLKDPNNPRVKRKPSLSSSQLDPYKEHIKNRFTETGLSATRLHEEVISMGYAGSERTVRRFVATLKKTVVVQSKLTARFESPLGLQAQCDWFEPGEITWNDGTCQKVYGLEILLSASRNSFILYTSDMTMASLLKGLEDAFAYFEGVPQQILFDNMKCVRIGPSKINATMLDFASHHGFVVKTHRPGRPRTKGKIERFGSYAQDNFLKGRTFDNLDDLNAQNRRWLDDKANVRIHGSTGRKPIDDWRKEKACLQPIQTAWLGMPVRRKVSVESTVAFNGNQYSVPPVYCQQEVMVQAVLGRIQVRLGDLVIADHELAKGKNRKIFDRKHLADIWKLSTPEGTPPPEILATLGPDVQQVDLSVYGKVCS